MDFNAIDYKNFDESTFYHFSDDNVAEMSDFIDQFFFKQGYKLEEGSKGNGIYGKGNKILRFILGGFVNRFKYKVRVEKKEDMVVNVTKAMSGAMGGAIGYSKMKKEMKRLITLLNELFSVQ